MYTDTSEVEQSLAHLSLEYVTHYQKHSQRWLNIFRLHPSSKTLPPTRLDSTFTKNLENYLAAREKPTSIANKDIYSKEVWKFCLKWKINEQKFQNFKKLLDGRLHFPILLLQNPCDSHDKTYDVMIQSPVLSWLRTELNSVGLELDDVIIMDVVPLFTKRDLERMTDQKRRSAMIESFGLTTRFLQLFKPSMLVSCQCATNGHQESLYRPLDDPIAYEISSSTERAEKFEVRCVSIGSHRVITVQGFHPAHILRLENRPTADRLTGCLREILRMVYQPCGIWNKRRKDQIAVEKLAEDEKLIQQQFENLASLLKTHREAKDGAKRRGLSVQEKKIVVDEAELAVFADYLCDLLP